ncbi:cryptochrome/deoxyribodipyrimidine photo-lyase family protein [Polynucleobacter sp. HIN5]|uniref:cryptochrome/deoxyribodipyrimidine photo-lyase family protein n=1 Tax=Polynucleobacter sp. HIN5 TaxID=3047864 RepID=UPI0025746F3F|nr:FAD-binding domain-containing protein [Polynucleobacter sp. HIN5]BEI33754.1 deoxyribodipyrimidine photo-lyase [Polynucleobacter sp. HIN5]
MSYQLVWFKRDLRWEDHAALAHAAKRGPIRCIYIVEPGLWQQADMALSHFKFIAESLIDLDAELRKQGGGLEVFTGEVVEILERLWQVQPFAGLHSHEETGNQWTYDRDRRVGRWCRDHHILWHEYPQFGVVRRLKSRNAWQSAWERHMASPPATVSPLSFWNHSIPPLPVINPPAHLQHDPPQRQRGGRNLAVKTLNDFLTHRSQRYRGGISSPLISPQACSRISTYLAYGCLSMREVVNRTRAQIAKAEGISARQKAGLRAFLSRLYWHCHFIQKLESEPEIEWRNMHRGYDGLRENDFHHQHFEALKAAQTGWPMVDACVVMLRETGWLNFRMRAMLVSVAAYPLWLHWRPVGEWLATQFLDYEPGIHWSQLQMQSGTTGINTTRVYNPIKQAMDHDPTGEFVRTWLPIMRKVPDTYLFEPWNMPQALQEQLGIRVGVEIPLPIVDLAIATKEAKSRLYGRRQLAEVRIAKQAVLEKHGSRKTMHRTRVKVALDKAQLGFDF